MGSAPRPGHKPENPRAATYFALLLTDHPPADDIQLLSAEAEGPDVRLRCETLAVSESSSCVLLLATPAVMLPFRTPRAIPVQRGRRGGKAPETLLLLQAVSPAILAQNKVQRAGLSKSILRAVEALKSSAQPSRFDGWLAVELATVGFVTRANALRLSKECDAPAPEAGGELIRADQLLVWRDYIDRESGRMLNLLQKQVGVNPLLDRLDLLHVATALGLALRPLCLRVLLAVGQRLGAAEDRSLLGAYVPLTNLSDKRPALNPADQSLVKSILEDYENSDGMRLEKLRALHPSALHVIDWMLKAHLLYQTPTGYVLTRGQMDKAFAQLHCSIGQPGIPGVSEIKQKLRWGRALGEALRELLSREDVLEVAAYGPRRVERGGA